MISAMSRSATWPGRSEIFPQISVSSAATWSRCSRHDGMPFPDEVSALVLKSLATTVRSKDTDTTDIWRCLEIAFAAGLGPADFTRGVRAETAEVIRSLFGSRRGAAVAALAAEQHLSAEAADIRFTRIWALIAHLLGPT
jgi:hypothetical protein